jgi:voltage-gated potassium channel
MKPSKIRQDAFGKPDSGWRTRFHTVVFEADTRAGRAFDIGLMAVIVLSVLTVILDSVPTIRARQFQTLFVLEWIFTVLFTIEYVLRLACVKRPLRYALSFFGLIDLMSILPTYIAFFMPEAHALIDIRLLRMLRVYRVLKLPRYFDESQILMEALRNSRHKIAVFLGTIFILCIILGTLMYLIEGPANGFTSIPTAMYWAVVTLTTTGYGDIHPKTPFGQAVTSLVMLMGYGIIALPTGIVGAELAMSMSRKKPTTRTCTQCLSEGHEADAAYCKDCGSRLSPYLSGT